MLRKFISRFSFSCIKNQDETDESQQQNIENEHTVKFKCFAERPKSREIPIPSTLRSGSGGQKDSLARDFEAGESMNYIRMNRNKCRQSAEEVQMARISLHDLMDLDVGFQFGKNGRTGFTGSKAERNGETPPRKDEDTERSLVTPDNSSFRSASGRSNLPRNCMIKIGSIIESADGSLPCINVAEKGSEQVIFPLGDVGSTFLRSTNLRETGIYYNTNTGTVELHGGMNHNDYTV